MSARPEEWLARRGGARELLRVPAALFGALACARNGLYDVGLLPAARLPAPVVSVGNLTVGGTGKTPMVVHLARELSRRGRRVGLLSRGYRKQHDSLNDEGLLLAELLPDVPHVQDADRVRGAHALLQRGVDVVLLDDGFQHRRLARDLDLVLLDATRPWGLPAPDDGAAPLRALLPRGLLREAVRSLARANALVITRSDALAPAALAALEAELQREVPGVARLLAEHRPSALRDGATRLAPNALAGRAVRLVSGIGNPAAFEATARGLGADVRGVHAFPDHHAYRADELAALAEPGVALLVTAKDAVKLAALGVPHLVLEVELAITRGAQVLAALVDALPPSLAEARRMAQHEGLHG
ncbi:MAG: tetraacyldisaccharide 4'-kinase [Planctomycetes bacterium]|nr:tetraacyldisaccharide 4'-kinase [Planctomycetota bacterium]